MEKEQFITTQGKLAEFVGVSAEHLSNFKLRKVGASEEVIEKLHKKTGIRPYVLLTGNKKQLQREFREFFKRELARKILNS